MLRFMLFIALLTAMPALSSNAAQFTLTGYVDTYITSDNSDNRIKDFTSINHNTNKFDLNIAYLLFTYKADGYRAKIGLQEGSIPQSIYYEEPKNIQQANVGVKLADNLWLDGGIMSTHIGGEITHPRMNFLSTHSNLTYFEPTYQTGFKLSYDFSEKLSANIQLLNGNHLFGDNNDQKTIGIGISYADDDWETFYSGLFGNEEPRNMPAKFQTYHNIYVAKKIGENAEIKAQIDVATLDNTEMDNSIGLCYGAFIQSRYKLSEKIALSSRYSFFSDIDNVYQLNVEGFDLTGGVEFKPVDKSYLRFEVRYMQFNAGDSKNQFIRKSKNVNSMLEFSINFGVWFDVSM